MHRRHYSEKVREGDHLEDLGVEDDNITTDRQEVRWVMKWIDLA